MAQVEVVVIGGGIVGLCTALHLSRQGVSVALLDKRPLMANYPSGDQLADYDLRVSALTHRSQAYLSKLDLWDTIVAERCTPYQRMYVWDGEGTGNIEFDADAITAQNIGHIVENRIITRAAYQAILETDVMCFAPCNIIAIENTDAGVHIELNEGNIDAQLMIASDGALSMVREQQGFFTREWDYGHSAIVATVAMQEPHQSTCWQRFMQSGPLALLPLDDPYKVSIVWSCQHAMAETLMALDDEAFMADLSHASETILGNTIAVGPRQCVPLRQRHATDYIKQRCVLIGDAAHTIHPLAGQGMNIGLGDSIVLVEELLRSKMRGLGVAHSQGLKRFQRRRKSENLNMMYTMEGFKRLFETKDLHLLWARNEGMRWLNRIDSIKTNIVATAVGQD